MAQTSDGYNIKKLEGEDWINSIEWHAVELTPSGGFRIERGNQSYYFDKDEVNFDPERGVYWAPKHSGVGHLNYYWHVDPRL